MQFNSSLSKKSVASATVALKNDGSNIIEGYCFFCGKKITQAEVRQNKAVQVPIPGDKVGWACLEHKGE